MIAPDGTSLLRATTLRGALLLAFSLHAFRGSRFELNGRESTQEAVGAAAHDGRQCVKMGNFQGSEDGSLWREGLAIFTVGVTQLRNWPGLLVVNVTGPRPTVRPLRLFSMPRPERHLLSHALSIDKVSHRLYLLTHDTRARCERILVFDVIGNAYALHFRFALWSPYFRMGRDDGNVLLSDIAVVPGENLLYATMGLTSADPSKRYLWGCTWDEAFGKVDIEADCGHALEVELPYLNGISITSNGHFIFANVMGWQSVLILERKKEDGGLLTRRLYVRYAEKGISLPGVDNVEYDNATGDLHMGMIGGMGRRGGLAVSKRTHYGYQTTKVVYRHDLPDPHLWVSSAIRTGRWVLLGSPNGPPVACLIGETIEEVLDRIEEQLDTSMGERDSILRR
jgi:hypothetical protein